MISLSSNIWSSLNDGISSASIRRVMSPRVGNNLINPKISSDEPLAALRDIHDGGTVSTRALHKNGCCFKNNSETHVMSLAEATVKPETARPLTRSRGYESTEREKRGGSRWFLSRQRKTEPRIIFIIGIVRASAIYCCIAIDRTAFRSCTNWNSSTISGVPLLTTTRFGELLSVIVLHPSDNFSALTGCCSQANYNPTHSYNHPEQANSWQHGLLC